MKRKRRVDRIKLLRLFAVVAFILILGRTSWLQAVAADDLSKKAVASRTLNSGIQPRRGTITDSLGKVLAISIDSKTVYIEPDNYRSGIKKLNTDAQAQLKKLADILQIPFADLDRKVNSAAQWVSLARQVDPDKVNQIKALKIPGIGFEDDSKRVYPMGNLLASVLGETGVDGHGVEGLELSYDKELFGKEGYLSEETDARDRGLLGGVHSYNPPQDGDNAQLTINTNIQYIVEQQLDEIMSSVKPKSATILVMDPNNGKVLAMGNRPSYDPNDFQKFSEADRRNLAVSMQYEPGSTFKTITASAALEEGTSSPDKEYYDPGYLYIDGMKIGNWDTGDTAPHGSITLTRGMELSANVVFGQVGLEMPRSTFFKYVRGFGFGQPTGIDLPGEAAGELLPEQSTGRFEQATMSFGQANAATPLQMLTAISAVANGGTLYKPYVVDRVTNQNGNLVEQNKPTAVRQVISQSTSIQMRQMLEDVVNHGTAPEGKVQGYTVAGKTGTAQKVDATGHYSTKDFIASFAGFAPAMNPKVAILVIIDSPSVGEFHQGGILAGPRFAAIMSKTLMYLNIPPDAPVDSGSNSLVNLAPTAKTQPKPVIPERTPQPGEGVVPDVSGETMSEAGERLSKQGFRMNFTGYGLAAEQDFPPGKVLPVGTVISVRFSP
ncbi:MAG TPA: penicillin-binding transpeptidase domain-containing protein [Desulfobacteria bacterium]|nr:penicillin-binding transpeptidase domain-containing protein [Desulfobacteria bacterium]